MSPVRTCRPTCPWSASMKAEVIGRHPLLGCPRRPSRGGHSPVACDFRSSLCFLCAQNVHSAGPLLGLAPAEADEARNKATHDRVFMVSRLAEAWMASWPTGAHTAVRFRTPCPPWGFTWICLQERICPRLPGGQPAAAFSHWWLHGSLFKPRSCPSWAALGQ